VSVLVNKGDIKTAPSVEAAAAGFDIHPSLVRRGVGAIPKA
jgi:hypothetical protein